MSEEVLAADGEAFEETRTAFAQHGDEAPSLTDLAQFLASGDADTDLVAEANQRLAVALGTSDAAICRWMPVKNTLAALHPSTPSRHDPPVSDEGEPLEPSQVPLHHVVAAVNAIPEHRRPPNPLAPLVRAWIQRPYAVRPSRRTTGQIIPARLAQGGTPARQAGGGALLAGSPPALRPDGAPRVWSGTPAAGAAPGPLRAGRRSRQPQPGRRPAAADVHPVGDRRPPAGPGDRDAPWPWKR